MSHLPNHRFPGGCPTRQGTLVLSDLRQLAQFEMRLHQARSASKKFKERQLLLWVVDARPTVLASSLLALVITLVTV